MTDYIDREAFLASKVFLVAGTLDDYDQGYMDGVDAVEEAAKEFPAADVRPVVHGKWIEYPECLKYINAYSDDHIVCSACEECFSILDNDVERFTHCPHCGAQMEVEE